MKSINLLLVFFLATQILIGQEKYAVIINAYAPNTQDPENSWALANPTSDLYFEFWNDVYLMWEMLYERGFHDENIFVVYSEGKDFPIYNQTYNDRYKAEKYDLTQITDFRAYESAVDSVFDGLANGWYGFPQIKEDDFLVLYTFGHGGKVGIPLLPLPPIERGGKSWSQLAEMLTVLSCHKKLVIMQQCFSGSSIEYLADTNTIILTAANDSMTARVVDSLYFDDIDYPGDPDPGNQYYAYEREQYPDDPMYYRHGEFNFHLFNATRRIDLGNQSVYYQTDYFDFALSNADVNSDNYTSLSESFNWILNYNSNMRYYEKHGWDDPQISDISNISDQTSLEYPTLLHTDITTNQTHRGLIGISKDIHVTSGNQLTIHANAVLHLLNEVQLVIDQGATLIIEDDVFIKGTNANNQIIVNGNIQFGNNVAFSADGDFRWQVWLNNPNLQTTIDSAVFNNCEIHNSAESLTVTNSTFVNCDGVFSLSGDITVSNTSFTNTGLYLANQGLGNNYLATVSDCIFTNVAGANLQAISLWNYEYYNITSNTISGYYDGIYLSYSGNTTSENLSITDNHISNCTNSAISAYNSRASNVRNYLHNNQSGVKLYNNSNVAFYGNSGAGSYYETNFITDNDSYEMYASTGSFPWYFRYNAIIDEDNAGNPTDPMVYWEAQPPPIPLKDVRYNCWGNNFDPDDDLYPGFMVYPTWCPGGGGHKSTELALQDFLEGIEYFENEEYADAKSTFESVIEEYTGTQYAAAAMKELFALEQFLNNNYTALQQYYETNDSIQADTVLAKLSTFLGNKCDIALENWQTAIDHFETIIQNPESPEDSIFAIIDLGYTYFLMENNGYKSSAMGRMPEHKPGTTEEFAEKRDHLLSLLPIKKQTEKPTEEAEQQKAAELLHNIPNPFSDATTIYYNLKEPGNISIKVFDHLGKEVKRHNLQHQDKGSHNFTLDMSGLPPGVYFCSVYVNGLLSDTKKMLAF